jgi:hypothetical protein
VRHFPIPIETTNPLSSSGVIATNVYGDLSQAPPPGPLPPEEEFTKVEELHHLQMLIQVFDSDLKPMFDLRRDIEDGTLTHISFQDLWHLFQFGQDVRTNANESQVYRVVRWTGGRPHYGPQHLSPLAGQANVYKPEPYNESFHVGCAYIDFDGHLYAPGYKNIVIRKYEGEKAITSLQVFPISFLPNQTPFRRTLTARGDTWLQLVQPDHSVHKHYTGMTLDLPHAYEVSLPAFRFLMCLTSAYMSARLILESS